MTQNSIRCVFLVRAWVNSITLEQPDDQRLFPNRNWNEKDHNYKHIQSKKKHRHRFARIDDKALQS